MQTPNPAAERQDLIDLAARIPESVLPAAKRMLEALIDHPIWRTIQSAQVEDDKLSEEGRAALAAGRASLDQGETISHEEVLREFGR